LLKPLLHVRKEVLDTRPGLRPRRADLVCRENEAIGASVTELSGERVLDLTVGKSTHCQSYAHVEDLEDNTHATS
jgi:hypothetical protein